MAFLKVLHALILGAALVAAQVQAAPSEYQLKAVFLFNFSRFVEWPATAFAAPGSPFSICVLGRDPFGNDLDEVARGEVVDGRPLQIRRIRTVADSVDCQILFIPQSEEAQLRKALAAPGNRNTLIVSDLDSAAQPGAMIRLVTDKGKVRLRIDIDSARAAGLTISSKLLRSAEIVGSPPHGG